MLLDGVFNGDPHPGNILLCDDGRVGLVDYGQVARVPHFMRLHIAKICLALCHDDVPTVLREQARIGFRTQRNDPYVLEKHARLCWDNSDRATTEGLNVQLFAEYLDKRDPITHNVDEGVMAVRMCMVLWAVCNHLGCERLRVCEELAPTARTLLRQEDPEFLKQYS